MSVLNDLAQYGLLECLNPRARHSRLYWLTETGRRLQQRLRMAVELSAIEHFQPDIDWELYGFVCFSHRTAIVSVLNQPLTAVEIKRAARRRWPELAMSANNTRDALRQLHQAGVVERQESDRPRRPLFCLAQACGDFPRLLEHAAWRGGEQ